MCMPACRKGEHTKPIVFCACAVQFFRTRRRCFRGISTIGGGGFGVYMPAGQEGRRDAPFSFALLPLNFHGAGGQGGSGYGGSLQSAAALLVCVYQRIGRENGVFFFSRFRC